MNTLTTVNQEAQGTKPAGEEGIPKAGESVSNSEAAMLALQNPPETSPTLGEPTLQRAEFFSHTISDNKDKDTGIYVTVTTGDQSSLLARSVDADSSGRDATEYNDGSDHYLKLVVENLAAKKSECRGFIARVKIQTNGNDTWVFDATVTLYFSDGSNLFAEKDGIRLVNDGATVYFAAPGTI
jgi:hypothetical protein